MDVEAVVLHLVLSATRCGCADVCAGNAADGTCRVHSRLDGASGAASCHVCCGVALVCSTKQKLIKNRNSAMTGFAEGWGTMARRPSNAVSSLVSLTCTFPQDESASLRYIA